jgi:uncharacterized membrane-anchored protein
MKSLRLALFAAVAVAQLAIPGSMIWQHHRTLIRGTVWKFRTAPVDPIDAIRGRYIALRFDAEEFPSQSPIASTETLYALLKQGAGGFAEVDHVSTTPMSGDNVIGVERVAWSKGKQRVRFPFDRYWVTEENAPAAEKAYLENSRRGKQNAYVTVRVLGGHATLEQLFIDDQPLRDYLRAHPAP